MNGDPPVVLIVEDEPAIRRLLRAMLEANDYRALDAATAADAEWTLRHHRPDLVLLDLGLPDVDGLHLLSQIRKLSPVPIIVLSTKEEPRTKAEAFTLGANDYLVKLPDKVELIARIRYHSKAYQSAVQRDEAYRALRESQQQLVDSNTALIDVDPECVFVTTATRAGSPRMVSWSESVSLCADPINSQA